MCTVLVASLQGVDQTLAFLLGGSWDLVTRVINKVAILITPIRVLITFFTKSHGPPSTPGALYTWPKAGDWRAHESFCRSKLPTRTNSSRHIVAVPARSPWS